MNKVLLLLGGALAAGSALIIVGYKLAGIAGALGALVLCLIGLIRITKFVGKAFLKLGESLFESKSLVLRDAEAVIHEVTMAPTPESDEVSDQPELQFYFVDVTIQPKALEGANLFQCWDCSELLLVPFDAPKPSFDSEEDTYESGCHVHAVEPLETEEEIAEKQRGDLRLRLHVGVPAEVRRLKFQYYFETFGEVLVPK